MTVIVTATVVEPQECICYVGLRVHTKLFASDNEKDEANEQSPSLLGMEFRSSDQ
jgi:hypothetical protein